MSETKDYEALLVTSRQAKRGDALGFQAIAVLVIVTAEDEDGAHNKLAIEAEVRQGVFRRSGMPGAVVRYVPQWGDYAPETEE